MGLFDDQILSQPAAIAAALEVDVPRLDGARPIVLTGIGTSLHACRVAAAWVAMLTGGRLRPAAVESHELALAEAICAADQVVVVSHRGTKVYPTEVLRQATRAGAATVAITGSGAPTPDADHVLRTCPDERASTHTVSYMTALTVLGLLVAAIPSVDQEGQLRDALHQVPTAQRQTLEVPAPDQLAERLVPFGPLLITGSGLDATTAQEAALKVKEGSYRWAEGMSVEAALHGTCAVFAPPMAALCIRPGPPDGGRTDQLRQLLSVLGVPVYTVGDVAGDELWFAPTASLARPLTAVVPFQRLVASLARLVGASPETVHTEAEPWRTAMSAVKL